MKRHVGVFRHKKSGAFIMQPMGTFKGYGAHVGINPYREIAHGVGAQVLGEMVLQLLRHSGPTGMALMDFKAYASRTDDAESRRIEDKYFPAGRTTTSTLARSFVEGSVSIEDGQKSWAIEVYTYDPKRRSLVGELKARVKIQAGPEGLGKALMEALDLGQQKVPKEKGSRS